MHIKYYGCSKAWLLTYDDLSPSEIRSGLQRLDLDVLFTCATESKCYLELKARKVVRSKKFFDIGNHSCKFRPAKRFEAEVRAILSENNYLGVGIVAKEHERLFSALPLLILKRPVLSDALGVLNRPLNTPFEQQLTVGDHKVDLSVKRRHLYFVGEPSTGKTTYWKTHLENTSYNIGPQNNNWLGFDDSKPWVIFDEWSIHQALEIGIGNLLHLMDGDCILNTRGGLIKAMEPHVLLFCSRFRPEDTIPAHSIDAFLKRVNIIKFA